MPPVLGNTSRVRARRSRSGFTLLEVLVATAVTLLMMVALAKIFSDIGRSMKQGRAALELNGRLRDVTYRIQTSLNNATASPNSPPGTVRGRGYTEIYDGPATEHSAQQLVGSLVNRFGDVDDILMFTARAGDIWFTGKVPGFILQGRAPTTLDADGNGRFDDFENLISIASQHAEIAVWMQPVVAGEKPGFTFQNPQRDLSYLVGNPAFYQDNDSDGLPDSWRLHYRVNIIRPDLNLPSGVLPNDIGNGLFVVGPQSVSLPDGSSTSLPSPICDMYRVHGVCDLSMRRLFDGDGTTRDFVAANSLEDLENPANRFAHVQVPIPGTASTTMPLLALTPALPIHNQEPLFFDFSGGAPSVGGSGLIGSGFLHPAYSLLGERVGEDILANDVLAFDIKAYDPGVPILASEGADAGAGSQGEDDDGNGTVDDASERGWAGSDDLILSPNDPGYGIYLTQLIANGVPAANVTVGTGEYVDLAWARKLDSHSLAAGGSTATGAMNLWSPFSGYSFNNFANNSLPKYTDGLTQSGKTLVTTGGLIVMQPTYDTWTDFFERDGVLQAQLGTNSVGTVRVNGAINLYGMSGNDIGTVQPVWRRTNVDPAYDGLDNDGVSGADNQSEFETSAPFDVPLRGIKISVRMENPGAREVRELPVSVEFVTR